MTIPAEHACRFCVLPFLACLPFMVGCRRGCGLHLPGYTCHSAFWAFWVEAGSATVSGWVLGGCLGTDYCLQACRCHCLPLPVLPACLPGLNSGSCCSATCTVSGSCQISAYRFWMRSTVHRFSFLPAAGVWVQRVWMRFWNSPGSTCLHFSGGPGSFLYLPAWNFLGTVLEPAWVECWIAFLGAVTRFCHRWNTIVACLPPADSAFYHTCVLLNFLPAGCSFWVCVSFLGSAGSAFSGRFYIPACRMPLDIYTVLPFLLGLLLGIYLYGCSLVCTMDFACLLLYWFLDSACLTVSLPAAVSGFACRFVSGSYAAAGFPAL